MVNFIIIGVIILLVILFFKITSFRYERWWTYLIAILLIFLLFSFFNVAKSNDIDLSSFGGFASGLKSYTYWLISFGKDAASITGRVTNIDWNVTQNASVKLGR